MRFTHQKSKFYELISDQVDDDLKIYWDEIWLRLILEGNHVLKYKSTIQAAKRKLMESIIH